MSSISIETKKATELQAVSSLADGNLLLVHDGNGLKKTTVQQLGAKVREPVNPLLYNNAGAHNAIYRGENLGSAVTAASGISPASRAL